MVSCRMRSRGHVAALMPAMEQSSTARTCHKGHASCLHEPLPSRGRARLASAVAPDALFYPEWRHQNDTAQVDISQTLGRDLMRQRRKSLSVRSHNSCAFGSDRNRAVNRLFAALAPFMRSLTGIAGGNVAGTPMPETGNSPSRGAPSRAAGALRPAAVARGHA